jgi:AsmA family
MAEVVAGKKRGGWLRKLGWVFIILIVLLVVAYFVGTSSAVFKGVILPKVSTALNAKITAQDASIHPFSGVVLKGIKVETTGTEPLFQAQEIRASYHLFDIIGGKYNIDEAVVVNPTIVIVQNPDSTSNLDPITKSQAQKPSQPAQQAPAQPSKPSKPIQVNIGKVAINNGTVRMVKNYKEANARDLTELTGLNFELTNLRNGQQGKMTLAGNINLDNRPPAPATNAQLQAVLAGQFAVTPTADLKGVSVNGNTHVDIKNSAGSLADLKALSAIIDCDITPTDIKQLALRFQKAGANLAELRVNGPFDMAKSEGHLNVQLLGLDKNVLNLVGAQSGIDFGTTVMNSTNTVDLANSGKQIALKGAFNINKLRVTRANQTTPTLDVVSDYNLNVDTDKKQALINALNINGSENQQPFLQGGLTSPMAVAWGNQASSVGDSSFKLGINKLNLADWRPFIGDTLVNGTLNLAANVLSQQSGKQIGFDMSSDVTGIELNLSSNHISQTDVHFQTKGQASDLNQFNLQQIGMQLNHAGQQALSFTGNGTYNKGNQLADLQVALDGSLVRLLGIMATPDIKASSGTLQLKGHVVQNGTNKTVTGNFALSDFSGQMKSNVFDHFGTVADLDVAMIGSSLQIRKANGTVTQGQATGGKFDVTGDYDTDKKSGQFKANLIDFNENALRPFLASALKDKKLVSVSVNATTSAKLDPQAESSIKADFQLAKLVVSDPKQQTAPKPLEAKFQVDAGLQKQVATIRQFHIALSPTARASNDMTLTGQIDMTQTNATSANLKLTADSIDVTPYYDLFAGNETRKAEAKQPAPAQPTGPAQAQAPTQANVEPAPVTLPLRNSTVDVNIGRFYVRQVEITNWLTTVKVDGGHVLLNPFKLALNGAPVNATADLNLGVPGYQYDVGFSADRVPIAPLADSFMPKYAGKTKADLLANGQFKGAGITGVNLQKNLNGQINFSLTNAVIQVSDNWFYRNILDYVAVFLNVPDLTNSPINYVLLNGNAGNGAINIAQCKILSEAFIAQSHGTLPISPVLMNSPINDWPLELSFRRSIAQKARLVSSGSATNNDYVALPVFVTVRGPLSNPKPNIDKEGVGKMILNATGATKAIQKELEKRGLGNLLGGGTNAPAGGRTNKSSIGNTIGNILGGLKSGDTNQPASTNAPKKRGLFDLLPK